MPTLSFFHGIMIQMWWREHPPPHFHATYGEFEGRFQIEPPQVLTGNLPPRVERLVLQWAELHKAELLKCRNECQDQNTPSKIQGLP
jgi:hypothetical protein